MKISLRLNYLESIQKNKSPKYPFKSPTKIKRKKAATEKKHELKIYNRGNQNG